MCRSDRLPRHTLRGDVGDGAAAEHSQRNKGGRPHIRFTFVPLLSRSVLLLRARLFLHRNKSERMRWVRWLKGIHLTHVQHTGRRGSLPLRQSTTLGPWEGPRCTEACERR